ncbi:V-type ATP synthase subunit C [Fervidibacillus halotolerans]|uniref:V-type ATP synthase subunit C n=1 Tax=Fervidibacillus halotolerans TaxID=2980027 RepID=A0A9E8LYF9_9BACI|nr:V-type ATP synthase subunit C [Fervidibacillus halotolerans]WAA11722.1 V-type ATP synthase subunit C [Fervidibacillus halotolerans]
MDRLDFTQGVVRTRVLEKKLLTFGTLERLIDAGTMDEAMKILKETDYGSSFSLLTENNDFETILFAELKRSFQIMDDVSPDSSIVNLLRLKYDYHNLKVLLKEIILDKDFSHLYLPIGTMDIKQIKTFILNENLQDVDPPVRAAIVEVLTDYKITRDPQRIGIILDRLYIYHFLKIIEAIKSPLFIEYAKAMIDFINVRTLIRVKRQKKDRKFLEEVLLSKGNIEKEKFLHSFTDSIDQIIRNFRNEKIAKGLIPALQSYKETNRFEDFEKEMDNYLIKLIREAKHIHFGPEPIFAYLLAKETEMKNLRIILVSKANEIPPQMVRKRMRESYV